MVVLWFCLLAAAVIAYNAIWFPRTGLGAYYHDAATTPLGPLAVGQVIYFGVIAAAVLTLLAAAWSIGRRVGIRRLAYSARCGRCSARGGLRLGVRRGHRLRPRRAAGTSARTSSCSASIRCGSTTAAIRRHRGHEAPGPVPGGSGHRARHDDAGRPDVPVVDRDPDGAEPERHRCALQSRAREIVKANPTLGDVLREAGYRTDLFDRRGPLRQLRRELRFRPGHHAADRGRRFRHRKLQRAAAGVGRCEYEAGPVAVPVLVRKPWRGDAIPAADISRRGWSAKCHSTKVQHSSSRT